MQYISQTTFLSNCVLCLEHALGLLLVGLHAMSLALVEVLPLPVDEHLLVLALALVLILALVVLILKWWVEVMMYDVGDENETQYEIAL